MFAKLINNRLEYAPKDKMIDGGQFIVNFNQSEELMKNHGYKKVINEEPSYNKETQYLAIEGYTEGEDYIIINYKIIDVETNENSIKERIDILEHQLLIIKNVLNEEINK